MKKNRKIRNQSGFTLVEQLIVVALIVTVLGFGSVRMIRIYQENSFDHTIKTLEMVLRFLQMKSIEDGMVYELSVTENEKGIVVKREPKEVKEAKEENEFQPLRVSWISGIRVGNTFKLRLERDSSLLFYPDGSTSRNQIVLIKDSGERASLGLKNRIGSVETVRS